MDKKHNLHLKINEAFERCPRTGLSLLHKNLSTELATACFAGSGRGLHEDDCQEAYCELLASLVRQVYCYEQDPMTRTLPTDLCAYSFAAARKCGARFLDRKIRSRALDGQAAKDIDSDLGQLSPIELQDLKVLVTRGLDSQEEEVVDAWFFAELRHESRPSQRELARQTGLSRTKVRSTIEKARTRLAAQFAGENKLDNQGSFNRF